MTHSTNSPDKIDLTRNTAGYIKRTVLDNFSIIQNKKWGKEKTKEKKESDICHMGK